MEEQQFNESYNDQAMTGVVMDNETKQYMQRMAYAEQEKGLAEAQLEVDSIRSEIRHLLEQDQYDEFQHKWVIQKDESKKIFTEYGIQRLMQVIHFHINKNTLLSNFDEKQINTQMLLFTTSLNNLILLKYEVMFRTPTNEECKAIFDKKIEDKKQLKMYAYQLVGQEITEDEVKAGLLAELEGKIEQEFEKIRDEYIAERLREYDMITEELEAQVYATYNRAFRGEERGSLRRHATITDIRNNGQPQMQNPMKKSGILGMFAAQ